LQHDDRVLAESAGALPRSKVTVAAVSGRLANELVYPSRGAALVSRLGQPGNGVAFKQMRNERIVT
jgi:hypothetical protein